MADRRYSDPIISERKNKGFQAIVQYTDSVVTSEGLYVMGSIDGRFMTPNYLSKRWRLLAEDLGLVGTQGERPTLHDLRHTMAMTAVHNGADIKIASGLLGHSSAAMTLNIYTSPDPDARRRGMDKMDAQLSSLPPDKGGRGQESCSA